jgi:OOP family OmpA-OmpF porin
MKRILLVGLACFFFIEGIGQTLEINRPAVEAKTDIKGSKDHPMVSRIPGSWIVQYESKEFDQMEILLGKTTREKGFEKTQKVEGKITRIGYVLPEDRSSFEALRAYEAALKQAGFSPVYSCDAQKCGSLFDQSFETLPGEDDDFYYWSYQDSTLHYSAWKLTRKEGDVYVALITFAPMEIRGVKNSFALIRIAEIKPLQEGLVTVDAAAMEKGIKAEGHIALYGIYFDFNKADIKPESESTISEIAKLLKEDSQLKLYLVGHTDNVGTLTYNMDLSARRAEAVVRSLTTQHGIDPKRLVGKGVGPLAPVASNDSDAGRAKNRRVELVKQ